MTARARALLGAILLVTALSAGNAASAHAQLVALEPAITVSAQTGAVARTQTTLVSGRTYQLVVSGTYTQSFPTTGGSTFTYTHDAVYCFEDSGGDSICSRTAPKTFNESGLKARQGQSGSFQPFYRSLGPARDAPALATDNSYTHEFVAGAGAPLELVIERQPNDSYAGGLAVTLYGPPAPGSPAAPSPVPAPAQPMGLQDLLQIQGCGESLATPLGAQLGPGPVAFLAQRRASGFCPRRGQMPGWNLARPLGDLGPGDDAVVSSPPVGTNQRTATVTLTTSSGDVAVALSPDDARFRTFARRGCVVVATTRVKRELIDAGILKPNAQALLPAGVFTAFAGFGGHLLACLKMIDDHLAAKPAAGAGAAAACRPLSFPIKAMAGGDPNRLRFRVRPGDPLPRELSVTCRATSSGLELRIRPRRPGIALRRVVGRRLALVLSRSARATGTSRPSIAFRR
jgi:hypothetical protein